MEAIQIKNSKETKAFVDKEFKKDVYNSVICGSVVAILGIISLVCGIKLLESGSLAFVIMCVSVIALILGGYVLVDGIIVSNKKKNGLEVFFKNYSFGVDNVARALILSYPDPVVIVGEDGTILWHNTRFKSLCQSDDIINKNIHNVFPDIKLSAFMSNENVIQEFSYDGSDFILTGQLGENADSSKKVIGIAFSDISDITRLQKQFDDKKTVVVTAVIDNYDEVLKETPNSSHGALIGDIERCISTWVEKGNGFYRRYERDKFIILFEAADYEKLYNEKFTVLNEVKEIEQQNRIPVTLSIGVGELSDDLKENDRLSISALDIALGRGGDQAVIKTLDGYVFFGAKSLGVEKTTKVKARVVANNLCNLIDEASNVIIMGHKMADYDSFGAAVGLMRAVINRGKKVYIAMDKMHNNVSDILEEFYTMPEYNGRIIMYDRLSTLIFKDSLLILVDTHRPGMVEYPEIIKSFSNIVLIDHHRRSEDFMEDTRLTYHEPYASSTSEMITEVYRYMDDSKGLSVLEAEALYCGIYMDTKAFTFKTGARTLEAAAYLRKAGVDPVRVHKHFRTDISMYVEKSRLISNAKIYRDNIAIAVCTEPVKNVQLVVAQAADDLLNINGVEASFVLANLDSKTIISGRSLGGVNVQVILEKLGGGGHSTIAGAQLDTNSLSMAELKLRNAIDEALFD